MNPDSQSHVPQRPGIGYRMMQGMTWPMMKVLGMSCRHFAELCSLRLDRPLGFWEDVRFRCHGLMCHLCRLLPKQLKHLRALVHGLACDDPAHHHETDLPTEALSPDAERRIHQALEQERRIGPE